MPSFVPKLRTQHVLPLPLAIHRSFNNHQTQKTNHNTPTNKSHSSVGSFDPSYRSPSDLQCKIFVPQTLPQARTHSRHIIYYIFHPPTTPCLVSSPCIPCSCCSIILQKANCLLKIRNYAKQNKKNNSTSVGTKYLTLFISLPFYGLCTRLHLNSW